MSDESAAIENSESPVYDLDWDSQVEDFPEVPSEEVSSESDNNEDMDESEDKSVEVSGEEADSESGEIEAKAEDAPKEDKSGEPESTEESKALDINELADDAVVKVKVDGELQEISVKEFKNGISGSKAIAKRFSEYDQKEKAFKQESEEINQYVNTFAEKMNAKDPVAALEYLSSFTQVPAYQVKELLIESLMPEIVRRSGLNEDQLSIEQSREKLDFEKKQIESEREKISAEQSQKDLQSKIQSAREAHSIEEAEWNDAFQQLDEKLPANEAITLETVKEYVLFNRAEEVLKSVNETLLDDQLVVNNIIMVQKTHPELTVEELQEVARQAYGEAQNLETQKRLEEATEQKSASAKQTKKAPIEESIDSAEDWDDIL